MAVHYRLTVPDFRSGINTKLETGPGKWELKAYAVTRDAVAHKTTTTVKAIPSPTHMLLVKLQQVYLARQMMGWYSNS